MSTRIPTETELVEILTPLAPHGVQWFPGHMAKAQRELNAKLRLVNTVVEVVDARMPRSSRHPHLATWIGQKQHVIALTKIDLADAADTRAWKKQLQRSGPTVIGVDAVKGQGIKALLAAIGKNKTARVLVAGVPNSGKSSLINRACGRSAARVGATPGITRRQQWLRADANIEFLDTPGLLWPKIENLLQALKLAWLASIGEKAYDTYQAAATLAVWLYYTHPLVLKERYGITDAVPEAAALLNAIGRRRGCIVAGGEINLEQAAQVLLHDLRTGRLGRITLDKPEDPGV
ncbi:MAG: ribosome biogenesis GTPase YlqF [Limnochordia bacterium]